jgi:hypothetical protein
MRQGRLARWAPLSGPVFVILMIAGFIIAGSSPDSDASDTKIAAYLAKSSNQSHNETAWIILLVAMLFLVAFFGTLRSRLVETEGGIGRFGAMALGAGIASSVFLITAISIFVSPLIAADDAGKNVLDPSVYRITQDLGYMLWVSSVVVGALAVWATAAAVFQTGVLPRWFGWFSVVVGIICLPALFFFPIFVYWLWILVAGILLFLRPATVVAPVAAPQPAL